MNFYFITSRSISSSSNKGNSSLGSKFSNLFIGSFLRIISFSSKFTPLWVNSGLGATEIECSPQGSVYSGY